MRSFSRLRKSSFTLLEVLVTLAILLIILVAVMQFMTNIDEAWKSAATDPFAEAQNAFETVVHNFGSATLAPYEDYADSTGAFRTNAAFVPDHLARRSDLDFVCGLSSGTNGLLAASGLTTTGSGVFFLAPNGYTQTYAHSGMEHLLNAMGYFVEFGGDEAAPGFIVSQTPYWRWRLKQVMQPAESLQIFALTPATWTSSAWIQQLVPTGATTSVLAENIVTLIVLPERAANDTGAALAPAFGYDSRDTSNALTLHELPPRLRVVLVAMDATSAEQLAAQNGSNPPPLIPAGLFQEAAQNNAAQQMAQLDTDLAALDSSLTTQKINHRTFQREILLPSSDWPSPPSP